MSEKNKIDEITNLLRFESINELKENILKTKENS